MIHSHETTKTETVKVYDGVTCDLCNTKYNGAEPDYPGGVDWGDNINESNVTTIYHKVKAHYPGDSWSKGGYECHICPKCFDEKLIPWIKSIDGRLNKIEED